MNLTIIRTGSSSFPIELLVFTPNTSISSDNYIPLWQMSVTFATSQDSVDVTLPIVDDFVNEDGKTDSFYVMLSSSESDEATNGRLFGLDGTAKVSVLDDDNVGETTTTTTASPTTCSCKYDMHVHVMMAFTNLLHHAYYVIVN